MSEPDHVRRNRAEWDGLAPSYEAIGRGAWAAEPTWGLWGVAESQVRMLPANLDGCDAIELGCGTAYISAWLARRGARTVAIDLSPAQLGTARRLQAEHALEFELILGDAEHVPCPDASFDFAISEYGASIWCDPYAWIPEAARLLRPGGRLHFLVNAPLHMLCMPDVEDGLAGDRLLRPYFGMHRMEWSDDDTVGFHLPHGEMIAVLRASGFEIEELVEVRPPEASTPACFPYATLDWARRWPTEEVWKVRKRTTPRAP
jgi:SAM-dependent methyltransferase